MSKEDFDRLKSIDAQLSLKSISCSYGLIHALNDVSIDVHSGELTSVFGPNGAGKSTLQKTISGLEKPHAGEIIFKGQSIVGLRPDQITGLGISHVPERRELFGQLSVQDNLLLGAYLRRNREFHESLMADLENIWTVFPVLNVKRKHLAETLSGGEQQMLAIARGLMSRPKIILLDEPTLGLAPLVVDEVIRVISALKEQGRTILLTEQNVSKAVEIVDRCYLLNSGSIIFSGSAEELMSLDQMKESFLGKRTKASTTHKRSFLSSGQGMNEPTISNKTGMQFSEWHHYRKEHSDKMLSEMLPSFTLPDEYFEERLSYSQETILEIQDKALPIAYKHAFESSRFYNSKFDSVGLSQDSINGLEDLHKLPFTTSTEITPSFATGFEAKRFITEEENAISLVHTSSGTTGSPKIFAYSGKDIYRWAANSATVFWINGFRKHDIVLGVMPFGEFTGGGGLYLGMLALGAVYLPMSIGKGVTDKVMAHLLGEVDFGTQRIPIDPLLRASGILCLGSFLPRLEEMLAESNARASDLSVNKISAGGEPTSDAVRTRIAERFGVWPRDNYGLGEFYGPGVAGECEVGGGLHVLSDSFISEVVNPTSGEPVDVGEMGELVLTSLAKDAIPLLRYRTGDRVVAHPQNCPCGLGHAFVGRVPGRIDADDIVIPGGVIMNRTFLEDVILQLDGTGTEYALTVAENPNRKGLKRLHIAIEGDPNSGLSETIADRVKLEYNHYPIVDVLPYGAFPRKLTKARRIIEPQEYQTIVSTSNHN